MSVTVVCTDVVGSTDLAARLGDHDNAALWGAHDRVARELVARWRGRELERTDGIVVLFPDPGDALGFAVAYRDALGLLEPPLPARIGIHGAATAEVAPGPLAVAAGVAELARGGQILLTGEAVPPGAVRATPHGHWRLHEQLEPVEVFGVGVGDGPDPPPDESEHRYRVVRAGVDWLPLRDVPHVLPAEPDRFVGRHPDLAALGALVDEDARLISVTGIGGSGKTRLATRFGWTQLGAYAGGVWFGDLSEARTLEEVVYALALVFDLQIAEGDPVEQIGHAIAGRGRCLVILDNFEQITALARQTVGAWLARAREAVFVVTTREVLGLPGETTLALPPMPQDDAVELFALRGAAARRDFVVDDANRAHVVELVRMLDGLPLGIELAAARVRILPPAKLVGRMSERFRLLASKGGGRSARQATLRAALDWSWELLSPDEQSALAQLSVFEGGFSLEAAEAVLALDDDWPMDAVQSLVDKSLVRRVGEERFDLLMVVGAYATEKLGATGRAAGIEARHGAHYAEGGSDASIAALFVHGGVGRRRALENDLDNIVAACRRAVTRGDEAVAVPALRAAVAVLEHRGPGSRIVELTEQVLAMDLSPVPRASAQMLLARARWRLDRIDEARALLDDALAVFREAGRRRDEALTIGTLGTLDYLTGRYPEARERLQLASQIAPDSGDHRFAGVMRGILGLLFTTQGHVQEAREAYQQALATHRQVGNRVEEGVVLGNLGWLEAGQGRDDEAEAHLVAALQVHRETGYRLAEAFALQQIGTVLRRRGARSEALRHVESALDILRQLGNRRHQAKALVELATIHRDEGHVDDMFEQYEAAVALHHEVGNRRDEGLLWLVLAEQRAEHGQRAGAEAALSRGIAVIEQVGDALLRLHGHAVRATLYALWGERATARDHLARAEALAEEIGVAPQSDAGRQLERARAAVALASTRS